MTGSECQALSLSRLGPLSLYIYIYITYVYLCMYICGQTGNQLNNHFNRHRSDIRCYPDCCELSKHFNKNDCDFEKDLKISILEKVKGSEAKRQYKEDQWIIQLDSSYSNDLNVHLSYFGCLYQPLFKKQPK